MRIPGLISFFSLVHLSLAAQYFFTGEVKSPHGDKLQNGSITVKSTGLSYRTGFNGEFGITSRKQEDTVTLSFEGYEPYTTGISATGFLQVTLKSLAFPVSSKKNYYKAVYRPGSVSFSGNINQGSYRLVRKFLDMGYPVPHDAVQIEEMQNYFNSYYEDPDGEDVFRCSSDLVPCPWNKLHKLLCLNICARKANLQSAPPGNLVFLIDASGSMDLPNKLPIVKSGFRLLINNLRDIDMVSVIEFGGKVRTLLEGLPGSEKGRIIKTIEELDPDGSTPGEEGIKLAYEVARKLFMPGGNNRIILVTDGDIDEGPSARSELVDFIGQQSRSGIFLTCIGVGMGDFKNSELPRLAQEGQGNFAYADDEQELERLLVSQLAKSPVAVADSVIITACFNPALVKEYRLIGFDNKRSLPGDTAYSVEASRICPGHSLLALFELIPRDDSTGEETVAEVKVNYRMPGQNSGAVTSYNCPNKQTPFDKAGSCLRKAACIAMFGMKLRESGSVSQISWAEIEKMAKQNFTGRDFIDRDCMESIAKAKRIYKRNPRS